MEARSIKKLRWIEFYRAKRLGPAWQLRKIAYYYLDAMQKTNEEVTWIEYEVWKFAGFAQPFLH